MKEKKSKKSHQDARQSLFPNIDYWVQNHGRIEIGDDDFMPSFAKAIDRGGVIWEGKNSYKNVDAALNDLEKAIEKWRKKNT